MKEPQQTRNRTSSSGPLRTAETKPTPVTAMPRMLTGKEMMNAREVHRERWIACSMRASAGLACWKGERSKMLSFRRIA